MAFPRFASGLVTLCFFTFGLTTSARAWDAHPSLQPIVLQGLVVDAQRKLEAPIAAPCGGEDAEIAAEVAREFQINPGIKIPPLSPVACAAQRPISPRETILSDFVREPDLGFDDNLNVSDDQKYMGGTQGPTSRGFRHMYFGGWRFFRHPIATFQIPTRALGEAHDRASKLALKAKEFMKSGHMAWGWRLLNWSMHYIQDLGQPYHSVQVPSVWMVPWSALLGGPGALVKETTRVISNYHWIIEDYMFQRFQQGPQERFVECIRQGEELLAREGQTIPRGLNPLEIALAVHQNSVILGPRIGSSELDYFGEIGKQPEIDLPAKKGVVDPHVYAARPELAGVREGFERTACQAMANSIQGSRRLIEWALQP